VTFAVFWAKIQVVFSYFQSAQSRNNCGYVSVDVACGGNNPVATPETLINKGVAGLRIETCFDVRGCFHVFLLMEGKWDCTFSINDLGRQMKNVRVLAAKDLY
jgi:hypothetical protein